MEGLVHGARAVAQARGVVDRDARGRGRQQVAAHRGQRRGQAWGHEGAESGRRRRRGRSARGTQVDIFRFVSHAAPLLELILRTSGKAVLSSSRRSLVSKMRMSPVLVLACTTLGTRMSKASDLRGP